MSSDKRGTFTGSASGLSVTTTWPSYTYAGAIESNAAKELKDLIRSDAGWRARELLSYYFSLNVLTVCHSQSLIIDINWRVFKAQEGEQEQEKESWEKGRRGTKWSVRDVPASSVTMPHLEIQTVRV